MLCFLCRQHKERKKERKKTCESQVRKRKMIIKARGKRAEKILTSQWRGRFWSWFKGWLKCTRWSDSQREREREALVRLGEIREKVQLIEKRLGRCLANLSNWQEIVPIASWQSFEICLRLITLFCTCFRRYIENQNENSAFYPFLFFFFFFWLITSRRRRPLLLTFGYNYLFIYLINCRPSHEWNWLAKTRRYEPRSS